MAKQKKKNKQQKTKLKNYELRKYNNLVLLPYAISILLLLNYEKLNYYCARAFAKNDLYFYDLKSNSIMLLIYFLIILFMFSVASYIDKAKSLDITIKKYFSLKNPKAKKQVKTILVKSLVVVLLCALSFCIGSQQKYIGEENSIVSYSLIKQDKEYIKYNDVKSIDVKTVYYPGVHARNIHKFGKNVLEITLITNDLEFRVTEDAFNGNYEKIKDFLNNFNKSIINYDSESLSALNNVK